MPPCQGSGTGSAQAQRIHTARPSQAPLQAATLWEGLSWLCSLWQPLLCSTRSCCWWMSKCDRPSTLLWWPTSTRPSREETCTSHSSWQDHWRGYSPQPKLPDWQSSSAKLLSPLQTRCLESRIMFFFKGKVKANKKNNTTKTKSKTNLLPGWVFASVSRPSSTISYCWPLPLFLGAASPFAFALAFALASPFGGIFTKIMMPKTWNTLLVTLRSEKALTYKKCYGLLQHFIFLNTCKQVRFIKQNLKPEHNNTETLNTKILIKSHDPLTINIKAYSINIQALRKHFDVFNI